MLLPTRSLFIGICVLSPSQCLHAHVFKFLSKCHSRRAYAFLCPSACLLACPSVHLYNLYTTVHLPSSLLSSFNFGVPVVVRFFAVPAVAVTLAAVNNRRKEHRLTDQRSELKDFDCTDSLQELPFLLEKDVSPVSI